MRAPAMTALFHDVGPEALRLAAVTSPAGTLNREVSDLGALVRAAEA